MAGHNDPFPDKTTRAEREFAMDQVRARGADGVAWTSRVSSPTPG
jgi:hypothetical protein